jgi:hypothetical protein
MQYLAEIRRIYTDYLSDTTRLQAAQKPTDGLLGFGRRPDSDPCHDRFSMRLDETMASFAAGTPSTQEASEVLRYMFEAPLPHKGNTLVYLMLAAVHALAEKMICYLSQEDAAALSARYEAAYPKADRLPAQKKIASLLKVQAGADRNAPAEKKARLLDRFLGRNGTK